MAMCSLTVVSSEKKTYIYCTLHKHTYINTQNKKLNSQSSAGLHRNGFNL